MKSEPKPVDWEAVEEELLEALRSKSEEEKFERTAPGYTNSTNRTSSTRSNTSTNNNTNTSTDNTAGNTKSFDRTNSSSTHHHRSYEWSYKVCLEFSLFCI